MAGRDYRSWFDPSASLRTGKLRTNGVRTALEGEAGAEQGGEDEDEGEDDGALEQKLVHAAPDALGALSRAEEARALAPNLEQDAADEDDGDEDLRDAQGD